MSYPLFSPTRVFFFSNKAQSSSSSFYPIDGQQSGHVSLAAQDRKSAQYFEVMGSRGIYKDGWFASVLGPRRLEKKGGEAWWVGWFSVGFANILQPEAAKSHDSLWEIMWYIYI